MVGPECIIALWMKMSNKRYGGKGLNKSNPHRTGSNFSVVQSACKHSLDFLTTGSHALTGIKEAIVVLEDDLSLNAGTLNSYICHSILWMTDSFSQAMVQT
jgi:hypothetical protein